MAGQQSLAEAPVIAGLENTGYQTALATAQQQQQMQQAAAAGLSSVGSTALGAQEAQAWLNSQAGYAQANLGQQALSQTLQVANAEMGAGALQQGQTQAELNAPYEQQLAQQAYPFQTTQWLANIAEGIGSGAGGSSSTTSPGPSGISQAAGLGTAGLGAAALFGLLKDGGAVQKRAPGGGIMAAMMGGNGTASPFGNGSAASSVSPGTPPSGNGINSIVSVVPNSPSQPGHGSGPPKPPPVPNLGANSAGSDITGAASAVKMGDLARPGMNKLIGNANGLYSAMTYSPDAMATEAAGSAGAEGIASGAGQAFGLMAAAKRGGEIPRFGMGGVIHQPAIPHAPKPLGIAGAPGSHAFHPPGMPHLAPGGGIDVSYPNQTANEVAIDNAAANQTDAMELAMAGMGNPMSYQQAAAMSGGVSAASGGNIPRRADGGGIDDDSTPVTIQGGSDQDLPVPPIPPAGGPPPQGIASTQPAAQVSVSPHDGGAASSTGDKNRDVWTSVLAAGLGMMAGTSPFAGVNIGRGGLEGLQFGEQVHQREEQAELRRQQQDSNNLYRQGLLADKGQGRDIQQQRAETYATLSQASASQKMAQAALESARAASGAASHATEGDITMQAMKSLIGQPNPDNGGKPWNPADAYRYVKGMDIREQNAQTMAQRAGTTADQGQQKIDAMNGFRQWQQTHGDATAAETAQYHNYLRNKGATDEDIRLLEGSKNPITGAFTSTPAQAQAQGQQMRSTNGASPAVPAPAPKLMPLPTTQADLVPGAVYNTARGPAKWDGSKFFPVQ